MLILLLCVSATSYGAPTITLQPVVTGLANPVAITHAGDGSPRLFITLQAGKIVIYDGTQLLTTPFLDITSRVQCCGEQGLLSVAFHPNYASNRHFYVYYTNTAGNNTIARYTVSSDPNVADSASGVVLLTILQISPTTTGVSSNSDRMAICMSGSAMAAALVIPETTPRILGPSWERSCGST